MEATTKLPESILLPVEIVVRAGFGAVDALYPYMRPDYESRGMVEPVRISVYEAHASYYDIR